MLGLGIGLLTMPLIDFRVAPNVGLGGGRHEITRGTGPAQLTPTMWAVAPLPGLQEMPVIFGVIGRW